LVDGEIKVDRLGKGLKTLKISHKRLNPDTNGDLRAAGVAAGLQLAARAALLELLELLEQCVFLLTLIQLIGCQIANPLRRFQLKLLRQVSGKI